MSFLTALHQKLDIVDIRLHLWQPPQEVGHALVEAEIQNKLILTSKIFPYPESI